VSKRFTDTDKWDRAWFRKLSPKLKCVWFYLLDKCDHAGIYNIDFDAMSFNIGEKITLEEIRKNFGNKLTLVDGDKFLIKAFIDFQYGTLRENNKVHLSIINKLTRLSIDLNNLSDFSVGASEGLDSPLDRAKDKDKEKEKDKDKEKDKEKEKEKTEIIFELEKFTDLLNGVSEKLQRKWLSLYALDHIFKEFEKAETWLMANPAKKKNVGLFLTNWLSRSSQQKENPKTFAQIRQENILKMVNPYE
jgi:hypothetical protein